MDNRSNCPPPRVMLPQLLLLLPVFVTIADASPQYLACGTDNHTMMRIGSSIMGQPVGASGPGLLRIEYFHLTPRNNHGVDHMNSSYQPGERLLLQLSGMPDGGFFSVRVSDDGGTLTAQPPRPLVSKCNSQLYSADPARVGQLEHAVLNTPCDRAPFTITISLVAAPGGFGPFFFTTVRFSRQEGRASTCPPLPPPALPYPFGVFINESCPMGPIAQHQMPCPWVPCISPEVANGTCLNTPDRSKPARTGALMAEAKIELLEDDVTPNHVHYITGSSPPPRAWTRNMTGWQLTVDGHVDRPHNFSMDELQHSFKNVTRRYVLECASNWGRGMVPASQQADWWTLGGVSCAEWTGVLLSDVLAAVGVQKSAVYVAYYGEDESTSRGVPIEKALDQHTMLAWSMNGEALPAYHGYPLRMLAPGFPGSAQGKWLRRLWVRDQVHDGLGMNGKSYRLPNIPLRAGDFGAPEAIFTKIFTQQPVRSLIVKPTRCTVSTNPTVALSGKAWSGAGTVARVELSFNSGATWSETELWPPHNKWSWQRFEANLTLPSAGVWHILARATDRTGATQPMLVPSWNPGGYGNNQVMSVDVEIKTG